MTACPHCQAEVAPGDRFCSDCGARIAQPDPPAPGSRAESLGPGLAGLTDPGLVHRGNQDAFALSGPAEGGEGTILVVCDGVSNSQTPDLAALTAAKVAHDLLAAAREAGEERAASLRAAIRAAHEAVCDLPFDRQADVDPPATTIVAAWIHAAGATLGWLGDSRAYRLAQGADARGGTLLTRDHSWLTMILERGEMPEAEARRDPRAHALIHCLGSTDFTRASPCPEPGVAEVPALDGWLLLCSDGLWGYAETPAALAAAAGDALRGPILGGPTLGGEAAGLCARLVAYARGRGGRDNVTAVAARFARIG